MDTQGWPQAVTALRPTLVFLLGPPATPAGRPPRFVLQRQHLPLSVAVPPMDFLRRFFLRHYRDPYTRFSLLMCGLMLALLLLVWLFGLDKPAHEPAPLPPPAGIGVPV